MPTTLFLNEDLIAEILTRLPAKEIARVRCVCKRWLFLTSVPRFIQHHSAHSPHPSTSGFFLCDHIHGAKYFPLHAKPPGLPDPALSFIPTSVDGARISIDSSCNGLIICYRTTKQVVHSPTYYVCNPTTREFVELPVPKEVVCNFSLIFDPSESPHYKVVSVWSQIHIYSSQTRSWKLSVDKKSLQELGGRRAGRRETVYWNSSLVWVGRACLLSFDVEGECMNKLPMPPEAPRYSKVVYLEAETTSEQ